MQGQAELKRYRVIVHGLKGEPPIIEAIDYASAFALAKEKFDRPPKMRIVQILTLRHSKEK